jgi:DNA polymerase I-like protein with 3'-5' exonuclease and polymerase domains
LINYGIQNAASEILQDGAGKITLEAYRLNRPWMVPIMDIHDDLTFHVPTPQVPWLIQKVVPIMLHPSFDFITVPLTCEVKCGSDWEHMTEVGVYSSEQKTIEVNLSHAH